MTLFTKRAVDIFAAHDASGNARQIIPHDIQVWGTEIERILSAFQAGGGIIFQSKAEADGKLDYAANTMAWVFDDDPILSGIYQKQGAAGSGSWQRAGDLPYSFILAQNTGEGTADAIQATTAVPIPAADGGALIALNIVADNASSPVTVSFNGGAPLTIKTNSGADVVPGGLTQNMVAFGYKANSGTEFRLLSDQASVAVLAQMEGLYNDFRELYLGAFADDTAADTYITGQGLTKTTGTLYFNTTVGKIRVWSGASWQDQSVAVNNGDITEPKLAPSLTAVLEIIAGNRAALKAVDTSRYSTVYLREAGREGKFLWITGDFSAEVAADTQEGIYIKADAVAATVGAWVRQFDGPALPTWFGATLVSESGAALQGWLDSGVHELFLPAGVWRCDTDLTRSTDVHIHGPGTLDFSNAADAQLHISGSITQIDALNASVSRLTRTLSWASDQGLAAGDIVILWNPTDYSNGGRRPEYRDGMMFKVHSRPTATTVKTYEMAVDSYLNTVMNVYKMIPVRARIEGITVVPCSTAERAPIKISFGADVIIRDVKSTAGGTYGGIQVDRCYNVIYDCVTPENNSPHFNNEYGIIISNSQHVRVTGSASFATRHAVTLGGTGDVATVPNLFVTISGMSLWNAPGSGIGAGDCHGNSNYITYENCFMSGFSGGGRNVKLIGCTIFGMPELPSGVCVTMPEINGGYINFIDCEFRSDGDGTSNTHGYLHILVLGPSAAGNPPDAFVREAVDIRVSGCRFLTPNAGSLAKMVFVQTSNANVAVSVIISDCKWIAPNGLAFLYARETVDTAMLSNHLIVDGVFGPSGANFVHPDASVAGVPKSGRSYI